jgi:hypothetical protein
LLIPAIIPTAISKSRQRAGGHSHSHRISGDLANDHSTSPNSGGIANLHPWYGDNAHTDKGLLTHGDSAGEGRAGSNMSRCADPAVMIYARARIDDNQIIDDGFRVNNRTSHDCNAYTESNAGRNNSMRADGIDQSEPHTLDFTADFKPNRVATESNKSMRYTSRQQIWQTLVTT